MKGGEAVIQCFSFSSNCAGNFNALPCYVMNSSYEYLQFI